MDTFALFPTERTLVIIQLCLRSRIELWEKYYYAPFDVKYYFSADVGFTNIVVWSMGQSGVDRSTVVNCARTMGTLGDCKTA